MIERAAYPIWAVAVFLMLATGDALASLAWRYHQTVIECVKRGGTPIEHNSLLREFGSRAPLTERTRP